MSNEPGCAFGYGVQKDIELLEAAFANEKKADSKRYTGIETYIVALRDVKFPKDEKRIQEVENMTEVAIKDSKEAKSGFNKLIYAVLIGMIGLIATNIINQSITSKDMNKLYKVLKGSVQHEIQQEVGP